MAPVRISATRTIEAPVKKSKNRIVKRPARGYHRFRSGELNVTPKGGEKELVKNNQGSPLLRLPSELRTQIWQLALGGNILNFTNSFEKGTPLRMTPPRTDPLCGLDLLRTCRQIYAETALLPYTHNVYQFQNLRVVKRLLWNHQPFQKRLIKSIRVAAAGPDGLTNLPGTPSLCSKYRLDYLSGLERVHVEIWGPSTRIEERRNQCIQKVRDQLEVLLSGRDVAITFEVMSEGA